LPYLLDPDQSTLSSTRDPDSLSGMVGCGGVLGTFRLDVRRTGFAVLGVVSTGFLWSCAGSSTQGGDDTTGPVSEADFVRKVVTTVCGNVGGCCAAAGIPYDRAGCEANGFEEFELDTPPNAIWDSVAAGKCVDWYARIASSCYAVETGNEPCENIYRGTLPEGAACTQSDECADIRGSNATCTYDDSPESGSCMLEVEPPRGRSGDPCAGTCSSGNCSIFFSPVDGNDTLCHLEDGVLCSSTLGVCAPPPGLGEPCLDFYCAAGAYCSSLQQICQTAKPDGTPCESNEECTGGSCANFACGPRSIASTELCTGQ
jgi:hypothetical protein